MLPVRPRLRQHLGYGSHTKCSAPITITHRPTRQRLGFPADPVRFDDHSTLPGQIQDDQGSTRSASRRRHRLHRTQPNYLTPLVIEHHPYRPQRDRRDRRPRAGANNRHLGVLLGTVDLLHAVGYQVAASCDCNLRYKADLAPVAAVRSRGMIANRATVNSRPGHGSRSIDYVWSTVRPAGQITSHRFDSDHAFVAVTYRTTAAAVRGGRPRRRVCGRWVSYGQPCACPDSEGQSRCGPQLRPQPGRQALRLGGARPQRLRLLRAHLDRLEGGWGDHLLAVGDAEPNFCDTSRSTRRGQVQIYLGVINSRWMVVEALTRECRSG